MSKLYDKRTRLESAIQILKSGKIEKRQDGIFSFHESSAGIVDLGSHFHDKCADWIFNCGALWDQPCKHILAAMLYEKFNVPQNTLKLEL